MTTTVRKHISLGIIWCLAVSSAGCYTTQVVKNPGDVSDQGIIVKTSDRSTYELIEWEFLQNEDIRGKGIRKQPIYGTDKPLVTEFEGVLSSSAIVEVSTETLDKAGTAVAAIGVAAGVVLFISFIAVFVDFGRTANSVPPVGI